MIKTIVITLIGLIILYLLFSWLFQSETKLTSMDVATKSQVIDASKLPDNNTSNYTYSTWFYVNDWNYEFGKPKILLARINSDKTASLKISLGAAENNIDIEVLCYGGGSGGGGSGGGGSGGDSKTCPVQCRTCYSGTGYDGGAGLVNGKCNKYCNQQRICGTTALYKTGGVDCTKCDTTVPPSGADCTTTTYGCCPGVGAKAAVAMDDAEGTNCAMVTDDDIDGFANITEGYAGANEGKIHKCTVRNFPLQKWVNLTVSLYGRTLDVYMDGKLVRTCILPGAAKTGTGGSIVVTPGNGFDGWTSQTKYWPDATNPQQAYSIYKDGYGGSIIGNLFNKYRIRISFLEDNQTTGSFEL